MPARDDELAFMEAVYKRCPGPRGLGACPWPRGLPLVWPREVASLLGLKGDRLRYLYSRWKDLGWYDWATTPDLGWLTPAGRDEARELLACPRA